MKPQLTWYISFPHALALIKKMSTKKHRDAGYRFELDEVEDQRRVWNNPDRMFYGTYKNWETIIYKLQIYYEKPDETTLTNKNSISRRVARK